MKTRAAKNAKRLFACCVTKATREGARTPPGWKRLGEDYYSPEGWKQKYVLRAVALPVVGVIGLDEAEFKAAMLDAFRLSTDTWNWAIRQMLQADFQRTPDMERPPSMPTVDLYKTYNAQGCPCGGMATQSRTAIFQAAQSAYRQHRYQVLWLGTESLPVHRFPTPFPVHNQGWAVEFVDGRPVLSFRLYSGEAPRWTVRLACGAPFYRQLAHAARIVTGEAVQGQLDLYTQSCGQTDRNGIYLTYRNTSGGQKIPQRLVAKMVAYFPREVREKGTGVMLLRTDTQAFWVAEIEGRQERPWILNGDHILSSHAAHAVWLQRLSEDRKHEKRWPISQRRQFQDAYTKRCEKHHRRVKTWIDQMVAQVIGFAQRRNVGTLVYDDRARVVESFPWHALRTSLERKCDQEGIELVARAIVVNENPDSARES